MRKVKAFCVATLLFCCFATGLHTICVSTGLQAKDHRFGTWDNRYKDLSYNGLRMNITKKTMVVFGSSEFRHGKNTAYHPRNIFAHSNVRLMTIGGPFNQTLFHTVALGAISDQIKSKKVVLLVSPTWFAGKGVKSKAYALRFSKTEYMAFMEDPKIPVDVKRYVARRSEKLLAHDPKLSHFVKNCNAVNLGKNPKLYQRLLYLSSKRYATDTDYITMRMAMTFMADRNTHNRTVEKVLGPLREKARMQMYQGLRRKGVVTSKDLKQFMARKKVWQQVRKASQKRSNNAFYMSDKMWRSKYARLAPKMAGAHAHATWEKTSEYDDLRAFLKICRARGIKPMLLVLPVNGYWYDYTGMTADKRDVVNRRVKAMAAAYGAKYVSLSKYDYRPYITTDAVHPWNEGWFQIDQKINAYYQQN